MSYGLKYRCDFRDVLNVLCRADIYEKNYVVGTVYNVIYGALYNWYAANDARNIAATGFGVPTYDDWKTLIFYLDPDAVETIDGDEKYILSLTAGGELKETGTAYWVDPNVGATNSVGFNGRPAGGRKTSGSFSSGTCAFINSSEDIVLFGLYNESTEASLGLMSASDSGKKYGYSARLVRPATAAEQLLPDGTACDNYVGNDLKEYPTVKIGTQVWLACNLCETKFRNGDTISLVENNAAWAALTDAGMCYFDNDIDKAYTTSTVETIDLMASGEPMRLEFDADSDEIIDTIKPTKVDLGVISYTNFSLIGLCSVDNMQIQVKVYIPSTDLIFQGYVNPYDYSEPYEMPPYEVRVKASCGLEYLKNILFDDDGDYYTGRLRQSEIIYEILSKIGFTEFKEFINLYEDDMLSGVGDSPLDQCFDDVSKYEDMYCYEVLQQVLGPYNAVIRQIGGMFCIYRPAELLSDTVYGRHFTSALSKTAITISADQFISRTSTPSNIRQVPGGVMMIQSPVRKIYLNHDYGCKESWLRNFEVKGETYDSALGTYDNWSLGEGGINPISQIIPGETEGMSLPASAATPPGTANLYQQFGIYAVESIDDNFGFEFQYLWYVFAGSSVVGATIYMMLKADLYNAYLTVLDENNMEWSTTPAYINIIENITAGNSGWKTFNRKFTGLPYAGTYTLTVWQPYSPSGVVTFYGAFKGFKLFASSDEIVMQRMQIGMKPVKAGGWLPRADKAFKMVPVYANVPVKELKNIVRKTYEISNAINGKELTYDYINGDVSDAGIDNVLEQFSGALGVGVRVNETMVVEIELTGTSGAAWIEVNGVSGTATFNIGLSQTCDDFVNAYAADYLASGVVLTYNVNTLIFTASTAGYVFTGTPLISTLSGQEDLDGVVTQINPGFTEALEPTDLWNSRGGSENSTLIELIGEEIAALYNGPKQFVQFVLHDKLNTGLEASLLGNFQDVINTDDDGSVRVFVVNRGSYDVKNRIWDLDMIEIGTK